MSDYQLLTIPEHLLEICSSLRISWLELREYDRGHRVAYATRFGIVLAIVYDDLFSLEQQLRRSCELVDNV